MTILFITDIHGRVEGFDRLPEADVAVLGGDLTQFGNAADVRQVSGVALARYPRLLAVLGNCDPPAGEAVLAELGLGLHGRTVQLGGVTFAGLSGSNPTPFRTPYEWPEPEGAQVLGTGPDTPAGPLVLVSHAPPRDSGADRLPSGVSAGSEAVAVWVRSRRPLLVLCGHIHEAVGCFRFEGATVINPGAFRSGRYALIEIDADGTLRRTVLAQL